MPRSTLGTKMVKRLGASSRLRETNWEQVDLILSPIARIPHPTNGNELEERDRDGSKIRNEKSI